MRRKSAYATLAGSTATTMVAALQSFVLLPLYLSIIGPRLYGAWLATGEVFVWLLAFDFGIPNLMIQRVGAFLARDEKDKIGPHFATSMLSLFVVGVAVCSAVGVGAPLVAALFGIVGPEAPALVLALRVGVVAVGVMLLSYGFIGLARGLQDTALVHMMAFVGALIGFGVTAVCLFLGFGLTSIAIGLVVRAVVALIGGVYFYFHRVDREVRSSIYVSGEAFVDIRKNCPAMFAAGIGYALMNNSMVTIAALAFNPVTATVLGVTRKAADLVRGVLDMIGHASYGGFAHLSAEGERRRMASVYRELDATFFGVAVALLAAYVAANPSLIAAWVGTKMYGGAALTIALALSTGLSSWSYMQVGLYRSMGHHAQASNALLIECGVRLALMVGFALLLGPDGLPLGVIATSSVVGLWASTRIRREAEEDHVPNTVWVWRVLPLVAAAIVCLLGPLGGWSPAIGAGVTFCLLTAALMVGVDPALLGYRRSLRRRIMRGEA